MHECMRKHQTGDEIMDRKRHNRSVIKALSMVSQIGITMLVPIVLCFFIGRWLDGIFGTKCIMIIMTILGILASYRNLFVITKPLVKGEREKADEAYRRQSESMDSEKQRNND